MAEEPTGIACVWPKRLISGGSTPVAGGDGPRDDQILDDMFESGWADARSAR
jgi:hypothetical protein